MPWAAGRTSGVPALLARTARFPPVTVPSALVAAAVVAPGGRGAGERQRPAVHDEGPHLRDRLGRAVAEPGHTGAVDGGEAPPRGHGLVERGDVGEADEQLRGGPGQRVPVEKVEHPLGPEAAA